MKFSHKPLD
uniref:Uncharacterized protein n=1 Tax=Arundo donax TaxID=35708 RepID=A0A0A8Y4S0_ARUDO